MDVNKNKYCTKCEQSKDISEFYVKKQTYCKKCCRKMCQEYKLRNKDKISAYNKSYKQVHKGSISEYNKNYNIQNRKTIQKRHTHYLADKRKIDLNYKISTTLRTRIRKLVKMNNKSKSTLEMLGCSLDFLIKWFEFRFSKEMRMDNHGKVWHIDHVIPCKRFDLTNKSNQDICFHWTNLQPLYGKENIKKSDSITRNDLINQYVSVAEFIYLYGDRFRGLYTFFDYNRFQYL